MPTKARGGGKSATEPKPGGRPDALQKPLQPSKELAAVVGDGPLPRGQVVSKVWEYIKKHDLQNPKDRREILSLITLAVFSVDQPIREVHFKGRITGGVVRTGAPSYVTASAPTIHLPLTRREMAAPRRAPAMPPKPSATAIGMST